MSIGVLGLPKCCYSGVRAKVREMEFRWVRAGECEQLCTRLENMILIKDFNDNMTKYSSYEMIITSHSSESDSCNAASAPHFSAFV